MLVSKDRRIQGFSLVASSPGARSELPSAPPHIECQFPLHWERQTRGQRGQSRGELGPQMIPGQRAFKLWARDSWVHGHQVLVPELVQTRSPGVRLRGHRDRARRRVQGCSLLAPAPRGSHGTPRRTTQKTPPQVGRAFPVRLAAACSQPPLCIPGRTGRAGHGARPHAAPVPARAGLCGSAPVSPQAGLPLCAAREPRPRHWPAGPGGQPLPGSPHAYA